MTDTSTATPAAPAIAFLQDASNRRSKSAVSGPTARTGHPAEPLRVAKTTFHGESPWAALHLIDVEAAAAAPRTPAKAAAKTKKPRKSS